MTTTAVAPYAGLQTMLTKHSAEIAAALPAHLPVDRFVRCVLTYARKNPKVLNCTPDSIAKAIMDSAQLGLAPDGTLGSGYIVPYKTTATFIPGYRGLIELARRTGVVSKMEARLVRQGDHFREVLGSDPRLEHVPVALGDKRGPVIGAYAVAWLRDGGTQFEVMTLEDLDAIRKASPSSSFSDSPWKNHPGEMMRKCPVRRLCKYLPLSPELAAAIEHDDDVATKDVDVSVRESAPTPRYATQADAVLADLEPDTERERVPYAVDGTFYVDDETGGETRQAPSPSPAPPPSDDDSGDDDEKKVRKPSGWHPASRENLPPELTGRDAPATLLEIGSTAEGLVWLDGLAEETIKAAFPDQPMTALRISRNVDKYLSADDVQAALASAPQAPPADEEPQA